MQLQVEPLPQNKIVVKRQALLLRTADIVMKQKIRVQSPKI
jgi:hypothetical protein